MPYKCQPSAEFVFKRPGVDQDRAFQAIYQYGVYDEQKPDDIYFWEILRQRNVDTFEFQYLKEVMTPEDYERAEMKQGN
jgi:hypothetical protein